MTAKYLNFHLIDDSANSPCVLLIAEFRIYLRSWPN
jgi:hypothetical protein